MEVGRGMRLWRAEVSLNFETFCPVEVYSTGQNVSKFRQPGRLAAIGQAEVHGAKHACILDLTKLG